jgi:hypothetical protein
MIKLLKALIKLPFSLLCTIISFCAKRSYLSIIIIIISLLTWYFTPYVKDLLNKNNNPSTINTDEYDSKFRNIKAMEISSIAMRIIEGISRYDKLDYHNINFLESKLKTFGMIEISSSCQLLYPDLMEFSELQNVLEAISSKQTKNLCFKKDKTSVIRNFISKNIRIETKNTNEKCTMDINVLMYKLLRGDYEDAISIIDSYKNHNIDNVYRSNLDRLYNDTLLRKDFKNCIKLIIE